MGLPLNLLRVMVRRHKQVPFRGPVLVLGRQDTYESPESIAAMLEEEGIRPQPLSPADVEAARLPGGEGIGHEVFFKMLGITELSSLDSSSYEGAEIVADLNEPIDERLHGRFNLVLDGGTSEHVFDVRTCLANLSRMVRVGGEIQHQTPLNNYPNHGFYQFSPTLYHDYYTTNGFLNISDAIIVHPRLWPRIQPWHILEYDPVEHGNMAPFVCDESVQLLHYVSATKAASSTCDRVPQQSIWERIRAGEQIPFNRFILAYDPERLVKIDGKPNRPRPGAAN